MHRFRLPTLILLLLPLALSNAGERRFEKKFSVQPGGTLRVSSDIGSLRIRGTTANEVVVAAELSGRDRDIDDYTITAEEHSNNVEVKGRTKSKWGWFRNSSELSVQFVIHVPKQYHLELETSGGEIDIRDVQGNVKGETSGGNITIGGIEGRVHVETSGGNIEAHNVNGDLFLETSGGSIDLQGAKGNADVSTSGGDIRITEADGKVRAETSGGSIHLKIVGPNRGISAETSGGDIQILIGKDVGADLDAETSGGTVVCDLPLTVSGRVSESRVRGKVNGGGSLIYAHTSGGDVQIKPLP
jgi:DUF4097 and DUF4098 domain-containing protein YvlB